MVQDIKDKRIIFMGTPHFAVASLKMLHENGCNIVGVITAPDRPAGRGYQLKASAVKEYALEQNLPILQPVKLKDPEFLESLKALKADLQVVVAFRMLPEVVWNMPPLGTINLHGSLLPQYRGAAPINWAVINGEKETGVTTFFIRQEIDTGAIIDQAKMPIGEEDNAGTVHDRMMDLGADLLLNTVSKIFKGEASSKEQSEFIQEELKPAPKLNRENCRINWNEKGEIIQNLIRGLSPYPAAWTQVQVEGKDKWLNCKVFKVSLEVKNIERQIGELLNSEESIKVACQNGWIHIHELQLEGKKRMKASELLRGTTFKNINIQVQ